MTITTPSPLCWTSHRAGSATNNGAAELAGMLTSANVDERLLSEGAPAGLGDKRALPVLIAALDQQDELRMCPNVDR
jgi:hypothetical protein